MSRLVAILLVGCCMTPLALNAQGNGKGKSKRDESSAAVIASSAAFSARDRDTIRSYFNGRANDMPPGLAKRNGNLPPGLQKQLERNGTLPPGLQKRVQPFPADLERRLPRLPDGCERASIGTSVIILDRRTQRILDVLHDIVRP